MNLDKNPILRRFSRVPQRGTARITARLCCLSQRYEAPCEALAAGKARLAAGELGEDADGGCEAIDCALGPAVDGVRYALDLEV